MRIRYLVTLTLGVLLTAQAAGAGERWWGVSVGADFRNFDPMPTVSIDTGLWPENKRFGYQVYLEYADPNCDDSMWTLGGEAVWRYKRLYVGLGLSLSDEELCGLSGTKWHFSTALGFRISKQFDIQWRHRSHGADLGIRDDTPNQGVNLIQLRWRTKWGSRS